MKDERRRSARRGIHNEQTPHSTTARVASGFVGATLVVAHIAVVISPITNASP